MTGCAGTGFAERAAALAGLAAAALGWRPHEFWAATPAELALSLEGWLGSCPETTAPPSRQDIAAMIAKETP